MRDARVWFRLDPVAFFGLDAVAAMDSESVGVYLWLCGRQWQTGALPSDEDVLKRLLRGRVSQWSEIWPQVRAGFDLVDGRLVAAWVEAERAIADAFLAEQSRRGKLSAEARRKKARNKPKKNHGSTAVQPSLNQTSTDPQPRDRTGQDRTGQDKTEEKIKTPLPPEGEAASPPVLPKEVDTPEVRAALEAYQASRREQGHKALGKRGLTALHGKLAAWGATGAVTALAHAVASGHQGVFLPHTNGHNGHSRDEPRGFEALRNRMAGKPTLIDSLLPLLTPARIPGASR